MLSINNRHRRIMGFHISKLPEYLLCSIFHFFLKMLLLYQHVLLDFFKHYLVISFCLRWKLSKSGSMGSICCRQVTLWLRVQSFYILLFVGLIHQLVAEKFLKFPSQWFFNFALHILKQRYSRTQRRRIVITLRLLLGVNQFILTNLVGYKVCLTFYWWSCLSFILLLQHITTNVVA